MTSTSNEPTDEPTDEPSDEPSEQIFRCSFEFCFNQIVRMERDGKNFICCEDCQSILTHIQQKECDEFELFDKYHYVKLTVKKMGPYGERGTSEIITVVAPLLRSIKYENISIDNHIDLSDEIIQYYERALKQNPGSLEFDKNSNFRVVDAVIHSSFKHNFEP